MKSFVIFFLIFTVLTVNIIANNTGDWLDVGPDAKALGMGAASVAVAENSYATFWNPAALSGKKQLYSTFATLFGEVDYQYIGYNQEFPFGNVGISFLSINVDGFNYTSLINGRPLDNGSSFSFDNSALFFSYGNQLSNVINKVPFLRKWNGAWMQPIKVGSTLKFLNQSLADETSSGFGLDLGFQYKINKRLTIAGVFYNFLSTGLTWSTGANDSIPLKGKVGISHCYNDKLLLVADIEVLGYQEPGISWGVEYAVNPFFTIRSGRNKEIVTFGLGINYKGISFDYAYKQATDSYLDGSTRFSLGYVFGSVFRKKDKEKEPKITNKKELPKVEEKIKPKKKTEESQGKAQKENKPKKKKTKKTRSLRRRVI